MKIDTKVIRQYTAENVPNAIANHVKAVASYILVIPTAQLDTMIRVLNNRNVEYVTYYRKNDIIIAVLLKGV